MHWISVGTLLIVGMLSASTGAPAQQASSPFASKQPAKHADSKPLNEAIATAQTAQAISKKVPPSERKFLVLIDPAHGGADAGATIQSISGRAAAEKAVTLALAQQLRSALAARQIDARLTRDADTAVSYAQRAAQTTELSPAVCLRLHATGLEAGVHVFYPLQQFALPNHSSVEQWTASEATPSHDSLRLGLTVRSVLKKSRIPATLNPAAEPVLSRDHCTAVVVEFGPLREGYSTPVPSSDAGYQERVTAALTDALDQWRTDRRELEASAAHYANKAVQP